MSEEKLSKSSIELELQAIRLEKERLELEDLRDRVNAMRAKKEALLLELESRIQSYKNEKAQLESDQKICQHRKGGLGVEGYARGDDNKYAVIRHRLPLGEVIVRCLRCMKQWNPGDEGYSEAMSYPTDNQESGSTQFVMRKAS